MIYVAKLANFILPPRCIVTGDIVDEQGMLSYKAWSELSFISAPRCNLCGIPFDFEYEHHKIGEAVNCASCINSAPIYSKARSALVYDDISKNLILQFKHGDKPHFILGFLPWLRQAGADLIDKSDVIIPVPLHRFRLLQRRFNQAGIMAQYLAKESNKLCCLGGLKRVRSTLSQGHMRAKDRKNNVRRAFSVDDKYIKMIAGKNILLVDDVYTTGATVNECAKILLKAGAVKVNILTLARVVK